MLKIKGEDITITYKIPLSPLRFLLLLLTPFFTVLQHTGHLAILQIHLKCSYQRAFALAVPSTHNASYSLKIFTRLTSWTLGSVTFSEVTTIHQKCKPHNTHTHTSCQSPYAAFFLHSHSGYWCIPNI